MPSAMDTTIDKLREAVFSMLSICTLYIDNVRLDVRQLPVRKNMTLVEEGSALLGANTYQ
jgi:hypothetical protein